MINWDKYPWSNVHELNLNWIIQALKDGLIKIEEVEEFVKAKIEAQDKYLQESIENLQAEVEANLQWIKDNVQPIVNETINELIESGTMYVGVTYDALTEELNIVLTEEE